ncbi:hypothetical protein [Streptomyces mesophilus]|uniref:hypothetical protein n=1 Tax=Streptomyces mesophilus TaxID=1775132 RepID=UPI00333349D8
MGAVALGAIAFTASPAAAGTVVADPAGGSGTLDTRFRSATTAHPLYITAHDSAADGHHVRVRVQSRTPGGTLTSHPFRKLTSGAGTSQTWTTSLSDDRGILALRIQACIYEKDRRLGCDESSWDYNPAYT